jgi:hypothetical protein
VDGSPIAATLVRGDLATICYGPEDQFDGPPPRGCLVVNAQGVVTGSRPWSEVADAVNAVPPESDRPYTIGAAKDGLRVCARATEQCRQIPYQRPADAAGTEPIAAVSDDGTLAFVLDVRDTESGLGVIWGDTFDVAKATRIARVQVTAPAPDDPEYMLFSDTSLVHEVRFAGRKVIVSEWYAGPAGNVVLLDPLGGTWSYLHGYGGEAQRIDAGTLLVRDGREVTFVDIATGKELAAITAPDRVRETESEEEMADEAKLVRLGDRALLAYAFTPGVITIDLGSRKAGAPQPFTICK